MRCESCQERKTGSWSWSDRIVRRLRSIRSCRSWLAFGILYRKTPANPLPDGTSLVSKHHFARGFFASQKASPETSADVNLHPKSGCARRGVGPPCHHLQGCRAAEGLSLFWLPRCSRQPYRYGYTHAPASTTVNFSEVQPTGLGAAWGRTRASWARYWN